MMVELSDEDRKALTFARQVIADDQPKNISAMSAYVDRRPYGRALAVLDRLLVVPKWKVSHFDRARCSGVVECDDGRIVRFHGNSFSADGSSRWPRVGEEVHVTFNLRGELSAVQAPREAVVS